eukprot:1139885-Pelagomonas_calceolata.AAC.9
MMLALRISLMFYPSICTWIEEGGHGCSTRTARFPCWSGRDMAVPLGRNHAPPEVLLRQGAESGWVPQPDCLENPSTTVLEGMV